MIHIHIQLTQPRAAYSERTRRWSVGRRQRERAFSANADGKRCGTPDQTVRAAGSPIRPTADLSTECPVGARLASRRCAQIIRSVAAPERRLGVMPPTRQTLPDAALD